MIPPCDRNCPKRRPYPNCHGTCKKYIEFVKTGLPGVAYVKLDPAADWKDAPIDEAD